MATKRLNINSLLPETDYVLQVRAVNDAGKSKWSQKFKFTTIDDTINGRKPKIPQNVTWTFSGTGFRGTWDAVTQNTDNSNSKIVRYGIELTHASVSKIVTLEPQDGTVVFDLPLQRAQAIFSVKNITTVTMRVRAINASDNKSDWSAPVDATAGAPGAPTTAVVESIVDGIKVSWSAPADTSNVVGYRVYVGLTAGFTPSSANRIYDGPALTTTYNTTTYAVHYFKIRSYSAWGTESADLTASGTAETPYARDFTPPATPSSFGVTVDRSGPTARAIATWTFSATGLDDDIQQFVIRWRQVGDTEWSQAVAPSDVRTLSVDLPKPYANYEFQIVAQDFTGNLSAATSTVTLSAGIPGPPPQTVGLTVAAGLGDLQIQWTPSAHDDVTYGGKYEVQVATNSGFSTGLLTYSTGNTSISIAGLALDTTYYTRVRAVDSDGNTGTYSTTDTSTTTGVGPSDVTDGAVPSSSPAATAVGGIGAIYVSWPATANADPVTYEVHLGTTAGFTPGAGTKVAQTSGTTVSIVKDGAGANLVFGTSYYVKILARDYDGPAASYGTVSSAATLVTNVTSIAIDQISAGDISAVTFTISASGAIESDNYIPNSSGFKLSSSVVDIQSGVINFGVLKAGTMTSTTVNIGVGGLLNIDSTGRIKSNNYNGTGAAGSGSTGWSLGSSGLDMPGLSISAGNVAGDTITGRNLTVTGYIQSSNYNGTSLGWRLDSTTFHMIAGTITGTSVIRTNSLTSNTTSPFTGSGYTFGISSGVAEFANAIIYGNTTVSGSASHMITTSGFSPGSTTGWQIKGDGTALFNSATFYGTSSSNRVVANSGGFTFYDTGGTSRGTILGTASGMRLTGTGAAFVQVAGTGVGIAGNLSIDTMDTTGSIDMGGNLNMGFFNITNVTNLGVSGQLTGNTRFGGRVNADGEIHTNFSGSSGGLYDDVWISGGSTTATINTNGRIIRTSTIKMKEAIEDMTVSEARSVLGLKSYTFEFKKDGPFKDPRRYPGFIAEQGADAGAELWVGRQHKITRDKDGRVKSVTRDKNGEVIYFRTSDVTVAHNMLIKELYERIEALEKLVNN